MKYYIFQNNLENWQKVFWLAAGVNVIGTIGYFILAGGEELDWAKPKKKKTEKDNLRKYSSELNFQDNNFLSSFHHKKMRKQ